jgi:hypothetical protein
VGPWGPHALNPPWVTGGPLDPPGPLRYILRDVTRLERSGARERGAEQERGERSKREGRGARERGAEKERGERSTREGSGARERGEEQERGERRKREGSGARERGAGAHCLLTSTFNAATKARGRLNTCACGRLGNLPRCPRDECA